jgi:hypothetical protein
MKLNVCGEWNGAAYFIIHLCHCKHLLRTGLATLPDGGMCIIIIHIFSDHSDDRISLARFNNEGDMLWFKPIPRDDPDMNNEDDYDLLYVPDSGFMITGSCYYRDPFHPQPLDVAQALFYTYRS